jgi:hypothetical protein
MEESKEKDYVSSIYMFLASIPRNQQGIRKVSVKWECIFQILEIIKVANLDVIQTSSMLKAVLEEGHDPNAYAYTNKLTDELYFFEIKAEDKPNGSYFMHLKIDLCKKLLKNIEYPLAAMRYRSYSEHYAEMYKIIKKIDGFGKPPERDWAREAVLNYLASRSQEEIDLDNYIDRMSEMRLVSGADFRDSVGEDSEERNSELMDYNDSASKSHDDGWFYDEKD